MIKAIIFDLGGVLFVNGTKKFIGYLSKEYNVDVEKIKGVMDGGIGSLYREAKITRDEFWERALLELGIEADIDALEDEWINGYTLIEDTKNVITTLSKNYKIYYVSDNAKGLSERLNTKHNFREWFDNGILASEAGVRKPHPKIYEMIIDRAHVTADEMLYIDDKEDNLLPPQQMGMKTLVFQSPEQLKKDLQLLKLL